jgi:hypothetical protein
MLFLLKSQNCIYTCTVENHDRGTIYKTWRRNVYNDMDKIILISLIVFGSIIYETVSIYIVFWVLQHTVNCIQICLCLFIAQSVAYQWYHFLIVKKHFMKVTSEHMDLKSFPFLFGVGPEIGAILAILCAIILNFN